LGKRLLETSYFHEGERELIKLLKKEKGASYTQKMENMFQDMKNSDELYSKFKRDLPITFEAKILTSCSWPIKNEKYSI
jgi:hypothetical protein